jgi:hypothetical protein
MTKYKLVLMRSTPTYLSVWIRDARKSAVIFSLTAANRKDSNETAAKRGLDKMKSRIGTLDHLVAAACAQSAAAGREGKAKM